MELSGSPMVGASAFRAQDKEAPWWLSVSPLIPDHVTSRDQRARLLLFLGWLALVAWFLSSHVFWRDEVRAFSFALSGSNVFEMLRNVHGEGHPALWYLILRGAHDVFPYREVLPVAGAAFGIAAMAMVAFLSPFRTAVIAIILFSLYGAFEYVVIARNYSIAAVVMFALAALYPRIKNSLWLGVLLAVLANTNVASCILAAMFLLFRFVEFFSERPRPSRQRWTTFGVNALFAAAGAWLCFRTVYPTFNDAAVSSNLGQFTGLQLISALIDSEKGFRHLGLEIWSPIQPILLLLSCLAFIRKPAAFCAAITGLVALKLFFYFVYPSYYRHEVLYLVFLLSLHWMVAKGAGGAWRAKPWMEYPRFLGACAFIQLLVVQSISLMAMVYDHIVYTPYSRSADVAKLLEQPSLSNAIVMADPDTMLEPLPYYVGNPLWFLREQRFGKVVQLTRNGRRDLTLDDVLSDADRLHRQTGRPIIFLSNLQIRPQHHKKMVIFDSTTTMTTDSVRRFRSATRQIASLRPAVGDEHYDVFVYPK